MKGHTRKDCPEGRNNRGKIRKFKNDGQSRKNFDNYKKGYSINVLSMSNQNFGNPLSINEDLDSEHGLLRDADEEYSYEVNSEYNDQISYESNKYDDS
jgi:hypothetical protein